MSQTASRSCSEDWLDRDKTAREILQRARGSNASPSDSVMRRSARSSTPRKDRWVDLLTPQLLHSLCLGGQNGTSCGGPQSDSGCHQAPDRPAAVLVLLSKASQHPKAGRGFPLMRPLGFFAFLAVFTILSACSSSEAPIREEPASPRGGAPSTSGQTTSFWEESSPDGRIIRTTDIRFTPGTYTAPGDPATITDAVEVVASFILLASAGRIEEAMKLSGDPFEAGLLRSVAARMYRDHPNVGSVIIPDGSLRHQKANRWPATDVLPGQLYVLLEAILPGQEHILSGSYPPKMDHAQLHHYHEAILPGQEHILSGSYPPKMDHAQLHHYHHDDRWHVANHPVLGPDIVLLVGGEATPLGLDPCVQPGHDCSSSLVRLLPLHRPRGRR